MAEHKSSSFPIPPRGSLYYCRCAASGIVTIAYETEIKALSAADAIDEEYNELERLRKEKPPVDWVPSRTPYAKRLTKDVPELCRVWLVWTNGRLVKRFAVVGSDGILQENVMDTEAEAIALAQSLETVPSVPGI